MFTIGSPRLPWQSCAQDVWHTIAIITAYIIRLTIKQQNKDFTTLNFDKSRGHVASANLAKKENMVCVKCDHEKWIFLLHDYWHVNGGLPNACNGIREP